MLSAWLSSVINYCLSSTQEKFKRGFRRLFRRCGRPLGRDRRFSSAGEVSLTGAFHVEDVDACSTAAGQDRTPSRRRMQPRGSDASSIDYYGRQRSRSTQLTPVAVHCQHSPPTPASRSTATSSGTHLSVAGSVRYWPVNTGEATDDTLQLAELWSQYTQLLGDGFVNHCNILISTVNWKRFQFHCLTVYSCKCLVRG